MSFAKPIPILLLATGISISQTVRLNGIVKDSLSARPIGGVQVSLLNASKATTTDISGAFSFASLASIREAFPKVGALPYAERNGALTLRLPRAAKVLIQAYTLNGKPAGSIGGDWGAGEYSIPSPVTATGTYFYRLQIGAAVYAFKVVHLHDGQGGVGRNGPIGIASGVASGSGGLSLGKRSAQAAATDTLWFKKEGYASKKVPVADTALDLTVTLRPTVLSNGVRPGIWTGMTDQYTAFTLYVAPGGKTLDSLAIKVTMEECAKVDFAFHVYGPFPIPPNGVLSIGDSVTIAFTDSSVSGTFATKWHTQVEADPPCKDTQIYYTGGGGTIIQIVPRYNQNFSLGRRVPFESKLMELSLHSPHGSVKKDPDQPLYFPGEKVKLTAVPETLFAVTGWSGASTVLSENVATVDMNGPRSVTLEYTPFPGLTIPRTVGGSVTKLGMVYDAGSGWKLVPVLGLPYESFWHPRDTLILVPQVKDKYLFTGWNGEINKRSGDTAWVVMDGPKTLTPVFETVYTLTAGGAEQIPLKPNFKPGDNDTIMLLPYPSPLFRFEGWTGPVYRTSHDTAWVIMDASKVITPIYVRNIIQARLPKEKSLGKPLFSPDGSVFVQSSLDTLFLWDTRTGKPIKKFPREYAPEYFEFSPDGRMLIVLTPQDSAEGLDLATGAVRMRFNLGSYGHDIAFSPTEPLMAVTGRDSLYLRSSATGNEISRIAGGSWQSQLAFSPDGTKLAMVSDAIRIVDIQSGLSMTFSKYPPGFVSSTIVGFRFSPDGSSLNMILREQQFMRMNVATGEISKIYKIDELPECAAFSPDGLQVAIGTWNRGLLIRDVETGALARNLTEGMEMLQISQMAFSPDNTHLLSHCDHDSTTTLWDVKQP
jgi:WD40 repeat protein